MLDIVEVNQILDKVRGNLGKTETMVSVDCYSITSQLMNPKPRIQSFK